MSESPKKEASETDEKLFPKEFTESLDKAEQEEPENNNNKSQSRDEESGDDADENSDDNDGGSGDEDDRDDDGDDDDMDEDEDEDDEDDDEENDDEDDEGDDNSDDGDQSDGEEEVAGKRSMDVDDSSKMDSPRATDDKKSKKRKKKEKSKKTKKRRKTDLGRLFNEMAEEGEDDDDEEWETRETGEVVTTKDELEAIKRQEEGRQRLKDMIFGESAEDIAKRYDMLSEAQAIEESRYEAMDDYYAQNTQVAQQSLLPSAKDPKIFMIKCAPGREQHLVMSIMNKTIDVFEKSKIMKVKSAFCGSARGYIFVEALSDTLVREIVLGLKGCYINQIRQLAVADMTSALKVKVMTKPLQVGDFVRMKRGPYKGDLVRILALKEGHTKAEIQVVPRIDYEEEKQALSGQSSTQIKVNAGKKVRPAPQLFNVELAFSISDTDMDRDKSAGFYQWRGNVYKDGFLIKTVDVNAYLQNTNVNPTLEELKIFAKAMQEQQLEEDMKEAAGEAVLYRPPVDVNKQLKTLLNSLEGVTAVPYVPGDIIQVLSGEMAGLIGRILDVYELRKILRIESINPPLPMPVEIEESLVTKYIQVGVHVKVMGGQFVGHTGRVVAMTSNDGDPVAVVVSDGAKTEMYCNVSLLQVSNEVALGKSALAGYQKDDLVQLNESEVGMVIDVGLEALRILTQLEVVKDIHPNEIRMNLNQLSARSKLFDGEQKQFGVGDTLRVVSGNHEKQTGVVRHVYKGTVWLYSDSYLKHSGVMVVKARFCLLIGSLHAHGSNRPSTMLSAAAPVKSGTAGGASSTPNSIVSRQSGSINAPRGGAGGANGTGGKFAKDPLIGKTVRITKGPYRGLSAQVVNGGGGFYQVELLAKMKKVTLPASNFAEEGDEKGRAKSVVPGGNVTSQSSQSGQYDYAGLGSVTPYTGMQTPAYTGSETPKFFGNETPRTVLSSGSGYGSSSSSSSFAMFTPHRADDNAGDVMDLDLSVYGTPQQPTTVTPASAITSSSSSNNNNNNNISNSSEMNAMNPETWVENMVLLVKAGPYTGRLVVVKAIHARESKVYVEQRDGLGALSGSEFALSFADVKPPEKPSKGAKVLLLNGPNAGKIGDVKMVMNNALVVSVNNSTENCKVSSVLWLNSVK